MNSRWIRNGAAPMARMGAERFVFFAAVLLCFIAAMPLVAVAGKTSLQVDVDWETFLARHDLIWEVAPTEPLKSPFVGNGLMGAMLYQEGDRSLRGPRRQLNLPLTWLRLLNLAMIGIGAPLFLFFLFRYGIRGFRRIREARIRRLIPFVSTTSLQIRFY